MFWAAARVWDRDHGPDVDDTYLANRRGMAAGADQLRYRLSYHYLEPDRPVGEQVAQVWYSMQGFIAQGEGVMLDVEKIGTNAAMALDWCAQMEQIIKRPVAVYSGSADVVGNGWLFDGSRPLIFPHYTTDMDETRRLAATRGAKYLDAIQWSSKAVVVGVPTLVDVDQVEVLERFDKVCGW